MLVEPLTPPAAKRRIEQILENGSVAIPLAHAQGRMLERDMEIRDCLNVLRGGQVTDIQNRKGTWRYRVETARMAVVVLFRSETELRIVTAWRKEP